MARFRAPSEGPFFPAEEEPTPMACIRIYADKIWKDQQRYWMYGFE
ncbi:hypothetical protein SNOG_07380 [Parastagonospora nodorum SN15]|uniref:Uncharacterized protein n=1 Tax=Phaeosphaeria nodorum (strain SN15 / ATCC MYA-4574 / FGSC 10173) TaxID=321614 RepID=Q0ULI4_PHANO|nr:hypothetical protein SNOG_07380 [Parastagonospora nodorum SN15]EAT84846.1 hypothetical protein SNOG_07380 [Parastagonospora nodorum SN15]